MRINKKSQRVRKNEDPRYQRLLGFHLLLLCLSVLLVVMGRPLPAIAGNGFPLGDYYNQYPGLLSTNYIPNPPLYDETEQFTDVPAGWFAIGLRPDITTDGSYVLKKHGGISSGSWPGGTNFLIKNFAEPPSRDDEDFYFELYAASWGFEEEAWEREYMIEWDEQHPSLPLNCDVQGSFSAFNIIDALPVSLIDGHTYTFNLSITDLEDNDSSYGANLHLFLIKDSGECLNQDDAVYDLELHCFTPDSVAGEHEISAGASGNYVLVVVNNSLNYENMSDPRPRGTYVVHIEDSATSQEMPNLQVESISVSNAVTGSDITAGFLIQNVGDAAAAASMSNIAIDGIVQNTNLATSSLDSGGDSYNSCSIGHLIAGPHTVTICADANATVQEGNEVDNCRQQNFIVQEASIPLPDLEIEYVGPRSAVEGQTVNVYAFVKNIGDAPAPASTGRIWVDQSLVCDGTLNLDALKVGEKKYTDFCNIGTLDVGSHILTVCVNHPATFDEKVQLDNNCIDNVSITVTPAPKPDLVVEQIYPLDVTEYQEFSLSVTVQNQGQADAPACAGKFFFKDYGYSINYPIPAIAAGASQNLTLREENGWSAGTSWVTFTADYDDKVDEANEFNNVLGEDILIRPHTAMVYPDGHGAYPTIQSAVDAVALGGIVQLAAGTYSGEGNRDINFHGRNLNVRGAADIGSTLDCQAGVDSHIGFILTGQESQVKISNIRIINGGNEFFGGALCCSGTIQAVIEDCIFEGNYANVGGAIWARAGAELTVRHCRFLDNDANTTSFGGGAIHGDNATFFIYDTLLWNNQGGAIVLYNSRAKISNCTLVANDDGLVLDGDYSALDMKRTIISDSSGQALINLGGGEDYVSCSDFYNNSGGNWLGGPDAGKGQISSNPLYCDPAQQIYSLHADSPCALATCGFMGAFPIACGSSFDTDNDGMDDDWERSYFGNLDHTGEDDSDSDDIIDAVEFKYNTNPILSDTDHDGMPDGFEVWYDLEPTTPDAFLDADGDGACNLREYTGGTSPRYANSLPVAGTIHVSVGAIGDPLQMGSADLPFATIQQGVDMAMLGDTVLVHPGTYTGAGNKNILLTGKGIIFRSSDGCDATVIDCEDNGRGITIGADTPDSLTVDGFTITHGDYSWGAGLYIRSSNPTVKNCIFNANQTISGGGGVGMWGASPIFDHCVFRDNIAHRGGGAVHVEQSSPFFKNCEFYGNQSEKSDDGLFGSGGAIYAHQSSVVEVVDSSFYQNTAKFGGGAVAAEDSQLYLTNASFIGNHAEGSGGGLFAYKSTTVEAVNCVFNANTASYGGGVGVVNSSQASLISSTFNANQAVYGGGIDISDSSEVMVMNSILWNNVADIDGTQFRVVESALTVGNSDVADGIDGICNPLEASSITYQTDNIERDPLFVNPAGRDEIVGTEDDNLHLLSESPCIDAADNGGLPVDQFDLDGDGDVCEPVSLDIEDGFRIWPLYGTSDMGAMEYAKNGLLAHYSTGPEVLEGPISHGYSHDCSATDNNVYQGECTPLDQSPVNWALGSFTVDWTGYIFAPVSGMYTISSNSWVDGTIYVEIDGKTVADFDTGGGGYNGQVNLQGGHWVPVSITFASNGGTNNMGLGWIVPGKSWNLIPRRCLIPQLHRLPVADFNGDGIHDVALFYPASHKWFIKDQSTPTYGTADCLPIPADYDGDGITDLAVVDLTRPDGLAKWYLDGVGVFIYGLQEWIPVPGDYDGDGTTDAALFNPDTGKWYVRGLFVTTYGAGGIPVPGDYNGDNITDIAVFNPANNKWYIKGVGTYTYGMADCIPVPADYDGDGITDLAVIDTSRPDGMAKWYIRNQSVFIYGAIDNTIPVPGDYDGDGDADPCIFYQNTGKWYCRNIGVSTYGNGDMIPLAGNLATRYAISQEEGGAEIW